MNRKLSVITAALALMTVAIVIFLRRNTNKVEV